MKWLGTHRLARDHPSLQCESTAFLKLDFIIFNAPSGVIRIGRVGASLATENDFRCTCDTMMLGCDRS